LGATGALAASSGFLLGVDYSEWLNLGATRIATDASGNLYISWGGTSTCTACVTKLPADGTTVLWQNQLAFVPMAMAVDPSGGVYVVPMSQAGDTSIYVAKLNASGTGLAWQTPVGFISPSAIGGATPPVLAADAEGRAYVAAPSNATNTEADVVRLNAAGTAIEYTAKIAGTPTAIAVDPSGAAYVAGYAAQATGFVGGFLARVAANGTAAFYTTLTQDSAPAAIAVDANGGAVVSGNGMLQRVDSTGAVTISSAVLVAGGQLALDAAGNAYLTGLAGQSSPVVNSLATCGWNSSASPEESAEFLTAIAPDGTVLQTTYIPGSQFAFGPPLVAMGANSSVFVVASASAALAPTQAGPFPVGSLGTDFLLHLSPDANVQTYPLACIANGASFGVEAIAPGEIVTLIGSGLGPQQGVQTQATMQSPYPTQAAGVAVTFDGTPAPLLWVQNAQINAVAPWSLTPGENTQICVSNQNVKLDCLTWPVVETSPAVFTVDGTYAAAVNQDGTINSAANPAAPGSIVAVWATGLGPIAPAQADGTLVGLPLPVNAVMPVAVDSPQPPFEPCHPGVAPVPCQTYAQFTVTYAGPAPYMVAGVSQINFQLAGDGLGGEIYVIMPSADSPGFLVYVGGQ